MPRIRTIKPEFFTSDTVSQLPLRTRLTWIGLWTHSDDYGRSRDNVKLIKAAVWPLDEISIRDIEIDLNTLADRGLIYRYEIEGKDYIQVSNWTEHQKVDRPSKSPIPAPPDETPAQHTRDTLAKDSRALARNSIGKGKERKGKEGSEIASPREQPTAPNNTDPEPPPKCPDHQNDPDPPPCGRCKDHRAANAKWHAHRAAASAEARSTEARQHAETVRAEIEQCRLCDHNGYHDGGLCRHDPGLARRNTAGAAAARAALKPKAAPPAETPALTRLLSIVPNPEEPT